MTGKSHKAFAIFILFFSSIYTLGKNVETITKDIVLNHFKESLSWTYSLSLDVKIDNTGFENNKRLPHLAKEFTFRRDNERVEWLGKIITYDEQGNIDENSFNRKMIGTGECFLEVSNNFGEKPSYPASMRLQYNEHQESRLDDADTCGPLIGRTGLPEYTTIIDVFINDEYIFFYDQTEEINGMVCYKMLAQKKNGEVTVWIAPEKGYNAVKWSIRRNAEHYSESSNVKEVLMEYFVENFIPIENYFVPQKATYTSKVEGTDGYKFSSTYKFIVDNIDLSPDFEALGAFKIDLPNGTPISIKEYPGIRYIWQNGEIIPDVDVLVIEELDKTTQQIMEDGDVPPKLGSVMEDKNGQSEPNTGGETQADTDESQPETLSETNIPSFYILIPIGFLIVAVIGWKVFGHLRT